MSGAALASSEAKKRHLNQGCCPSSLNNLADQLSNIGLELSPLPPANNTKPTGGSAKMPTPVGPRGGSAEKPTAPGKQRQDGAESSAPCQDDYGKRYTFSTVINMDRLRGLARQDNAVGSASRPRIGNLEPFPVPCERCGT